MTPNGLRVVDDGRDYPWPPQRDDPDLLVLPMVWTHYATGRKALMVHSRCMLCLELRDGRVLSGATHPRENYWHASHED